MTKREIEIIQDAVIEHRKIVQHYYEAGKKTGNWKDHEISSYSLRAIRDLAESLGVNHDVVTFCEMHKNSGGCKECPNRYVCKDSPLKTIKPA
jgi:hypothetical protein